MNVREGAEKEESAREREREGRRNMTGQNKAYDWTEEMRRSSEIHKLKHGWSSISVQQTDWKAGHTTTSQRTGGTMGIDGAGARHTHTLRQHDRE
eukprot:CAMPEP_0206563854 /NCGR_PEP_ID=MMETSP0325_2-20121206/23103_1 /ASSEMBLY_ACC=CAM_ASM_000347 /TAXON_ID=2866 /ORGANISM="Crypthecodinium cohnii, Strain Seligo" /LENGTH=94 /DNA_ID=CAMNT_0054066357 /DNA_START=64 /DNA_END=348 /DNA_ORIENTATION=-